MTAHALAAPCVRCGFTLSAHADGWCPSPCGQKFLHPAGAAAKLSPGATVSAPIKTPLTYGDAIDLWRRPPDGRGVSVADEIASILMAVDVASREQERERCAQFVDQLTEDVLASTAGEARDDIGGLLAALAARLRDPEAIPAPRPGLVERLQASIAAGRAVRACDHGRTIDEACSDCIDEGAR